jgi:small-conductance mechanosensitive channel
LLAVNFIIFQIALILLIDKEQILGFIPAKNDAWVFIYEQVNRFYYLMLFGLISIIVLSNPYVGFGRLVLYALFGMLYSVILFLLLYWLHGLFKRTASRIFFATVEDVSRERFSNAKTWFGIAIICSFLFLSFFGLVIGAKIWGWPITLSRLSEFFYYPLIGGETESAITLITFFKIVAFIFIGFVTAYGLNRFVLDRIFDLLLIDPGVQHTVSSIAQYLVIITAVFLGFQNAKLGVLINYIVGALILGLGWVLKEPISDFVAYFIILVQRPIKIGDFIKIDDGSATKSEEGITGVVRKITARAVILRRKNSTTLVVPNSYVISRTIVNWNYTRNFIALDDIIIRVDYREDPEKVREILYKAVEDFPNILKNPKPWIRLDEFNEYGYLFMIRAFISSVYTLEKWEIASNIRIAVMKAFREHNIKIAPARILLARSINKLDSHH